MHFENCWQWSSALLQQGLWLTKRDLWMWLMQRVLEPPLVCTMFILLYETSLTLQLITLICWSFFVLLSSILLPFMSLRDPTPRPLSPAASQHQHGRQSTARRRCPPVGPIRGAGALRHPWSQWLLFLCLQDLPARRGPHGRALVHRQGERFQWGANWCSRYNCR